MSIVLRLPTIAVLAAVTLVLVACSSSPKTESSSTSPREIPAGQISEGEARALVKAEMRRGCPRSAAAGAQLVDGLQALRNVGSLASPGANDSWFLAKSFGGSIGVPQEPDFFRVYDRTGVVEADGIFQRYLSCL